MRNMAIVRSLLAMSILGPVSGWAQTQVNNFTAANIGNNVGGTTTYNSSNATYTMTAGGSDIAHQADHFLFLYKSLPGNGRITARINSVSNTVDNTKIGIMVRQNSNSNAANSFFFMRPEFGSGGSVRASAGGSTAQTWEETPARDDAYTRTSKYRARYLRPAKWLSAVRQGTTVTIYSSDDGVCWNLRTKETVNLSGAALMGVALNGHHSTIKATAIVSNLSTSTTVPSDINADCPLAQGDGDLAAPTSWIISPSSTSWSVSTINPEPNLKLRTCISGGNPFHKVRGADSPACPMEQINHPWATDHNYSFTTGNWLHNKSSRLGNGTGGVNQSTFWLRRVVNLTQTQINNLMFWGRWNNSVSIYVNGKLATNTYRSSLADRYHYLGMNDTARAALVPGNNVIAIRVECIYEGTNNQINNCTDAVSDFGLAQNQALANLPITKNISNPQDVSLQKLLDIFTQITKEQGAMGGTYADYRQNVLNNQRVLGWADRSLTTPLAANPIMRLASVDKRVTDAVTVYLYRQGTLHPDTKVFGGVLNVAPMPGRVLGTNVQDITVEHLRTHTSGITNQEISTQGFHDELAYRFGVHPDQVTSAHLARFYASHDACEWSSGKNCSIKPGEGGLYSNNGYGLLRYVAEVAAGKPFQAILAEMGTAEIVVARENPAQRPAREPGYMVVDRETSTRRLIPLDKGLGLSASASGLLRFLMDHGPAFNRLPDGTFVAIPGGQGGAMDGTRSGAGANPDPDPLYKSGEAWIWNSDLAGTRRFDDLRSIKIGGHKYGSCDPTAGSGTDLYRLQNMSPTENKFLNVEAVNGVSQLRQSTLDDHGWPSAKWRFEPVLHGGQTVYRISNSQPNQYIQAQGTQIDAPVVSQALPTGTSVTRAYWKIVKVGDYVRLENVAAPGYFLHTENGVNPKIRNYSDSFWSTRWYTCT